MAILTDEIKEFIVKGLARFDTPSYVAEAVRVNFGIEVSRQQVHEYDPACARPPAQRWKDLHAVTREKFLHEVAEIGVSHRAVRLRMLDRLAHRCERNSVALAIACLERAAKECGGIYEKRKSAEPQPSAPQLPPTQPQASPPSTSQPAPMLPAPALNTERYIELRQRYEANRNGTESPAQNQLVTGNSRISTVPPAS